MPDTSSIPPPPLLPRPDDASSGPPPRPRPNSIPPAPPPPTFPKWLPTSPPPSQPLFHQSIWPHRLLHVETMTSYIRDGMDSYNGVKAPEYNVLSYTWGFYEDKTRRIAPLKVRGVDWPIPSIKEDHFTVSAFHDAIKNAANGLETPCKWLWVDVACIPQQHDAETKEAIYIRGQEIGRQVEIFSRAQECFAWLSSLKVTDILGQSKSFASADLSDVMEGLNLTKNAAKNAKTSIDMETLSTYVNKMNQSLDSYEKMVTTMAQHSWFLSLWTLQELTLRFASISFLLDDGKIIASGFILYDTFELFAVVQGVREELSQATQTKWTGSESPQQRSAIAAMHDLMIRSTRIIRLLNSKAICNNTRFPNAVYSHARNRRASKRHDRIYGITQIYGISCDPSPTGHDETSKLYALEDEFGTKLVDKFPLLSQLYTHGLEDEFPRRSWLITQDCVVDSAAFSSFYGSGKQYSSVLFESFQIQKAHSELLLHFRGKAWHIDRFLESMSEASLSKTSKEGLFHGTNDDNLMGRYRGLMLDCHIAKAVLGHGAIYAKSLEDLSQTVQKLRQHYKCELAPYDITISLLGYASHAPHFPIVDYVAIVVAPLIPQDSPPQRNTPKPLPLRWERIGLMRWTEEYHFQSDQSQHSVLPPSFPFECLIK